MKLYHDDPQQLQFFIYVFFTGWIRFILQESDDDEETDEDENTSNDDDY